jgi:AcrR family transcriptional regulator
VYSDFGSNSYDRRPGYAAAVTNQAPGLRERKKARTRTAIQQQALRLFREQGYQATTVEQIAAAAEVAPSTVFRYFPTKDDLAVLDDYYSLADDITQALAAQPRELNPIAAIRAAIRAVFAALSDEERAARYERDLLMVQIPELWAANLGLIVRGRQRLCAAVGRLADRDERDPQVRVLVDAVVGVGLGVLIDWADDPGSDPAAAMDAAFGQLEAQLRP